MIRQNRIKTVLTLAAMATAILGMSVSASAQIIVTPDHIVSGSATATLIAVDVPFVGTTGFPYTGGPDWPEDADDGFMTVNAGIGEVVGTNNGRWEPDGTPNTGNQHYQTYNNSAAPDVSYTFDLPDGAIIYAIYATWRTRNKVGGVYTYSEGASSGNSGQIDQSVNPTNDLGLDWTDDVSTVRTAPFQRIFTGPITVAGGDGFTLNADDTAADNAMSIDAVVIDAEFYIDPTLPSVDAGADMITWSGQAVLMDPNVVNNDTAEPQGTLTYLWSADPDDGVEFDPNEFVEAPAVTITKATDNPSVVTMTLAVTLEAKDPVTDTMTIDVYDDSCLAAEAAGPLVLDPTDLDGNCITDFADFAVMAMTWLVDYTLTAAELK